MTKQRALIALGANQEHAGNAPLQNMMAAIIGMVNYGVQIRAVSRFFRSDAFPAGSGPDFINAAVAVDWYGETEDLLARLHDMEKYLGRERLSRWGARTLDLDLIALGNQILPDTSSQSYWRNLPFENQLQETPDRLILPHPRLQDRIFVLAPLREIAPDWRHPVTGLTVSMMCAALPETSWRTLSPI